MASFYNPFKPGGPTSPAPTAPFIKVTPPTSPRKGGGGSSSSSGGSSPAPLPVYTSPFLQQSFTSVSARDKAEQDYFKQQQQIKQQRQQQEQERKEQAQSQRIEGQLQSQTNKDKLLAPFRGVKVDSFNKQTPVPETRIETRQIGTYTDPKTKRTVPTMGSFLVKPDPKTGFMTSTQVYPEEMVGGLRFNIQGYDPVEVRKEVVVPEKTKIEKKLDLIGGSGVYRGVRGKVIPAYTKLDANIREKITEPLLPYDYEKTKQKIDIAGQTLIDKGYPKPFVRSALFTTGAAFNLVEDVKTKPLKYATIYGATAGIGAGLTLGTRGVVAGTTKIFGSKVGAVTGASLKLGQVGAGVYFGGKYATSVGSNVLSSIREDDYTSAGGKFGVGAAEFGVAVAGFRGGTKLATQTRGLFSTRGREEIIIKQGDYPSAPQQQQIKMFKKNVIKQLGKDPGAFHTTQRVFWKDGRITPQQGTSELPGLYGSTQISRPFARISGSGEKSKWFPGVKDILTVDTGKPGVAFLQPKGFRTSPAVRTPTIIDGQKFSYKWIKPARPGYADVPKIKTEIEAIFRPEAGDYVFKSGKYFTTIKGVRVPVDVFKYDVVPKIKTPIIKGTPKVIPPKTFARLSSRGSYSPVPSSPIINPEAGISSLFSRRRTPQIVSSRIPLTSRRTPGIYYTPSYIPRGGRSYIPSSYTGGGSSSLRLPPSSTGSSIAPPTTPIKRRPVTGKLPKLPKIKDVSMRKPQIKKSRTKYQVSLTGVFTGARLQVPESLAGGLGVRGYKSSGRRKKK